MKRRSDERRGKSKPRGWGRRTSWRDGLEAGGKGEELPPSCGQWSFLEMSHLETLVLG